MTALEETYWIAKCHDSPLPTQRIEAQLAQIAQFLHNVNVKKQDRKGLTDFMLWFKKKPEAPENVDQKIRSMFGINKGK
jgi:hypothetical protein